MRVASFSRIAKIRRTWTEWNELLRINRGEIDIAKLNLS